METSTVCCPALPTDLMQTIFPGWPWSSVSLSEVETEVSHCFLISRFGNFECLAESWWKDHSVSCVAVRLASEIGNWVLALPLAGECARVTEGQALPGGGEQYWHYSRGKGNLKSKYQKKKKKKEQGRKCVQ